MSLFFLYIFFSQKKNYVIEKEIDKESGSIKPDSVQPMTGIQYNKLDQVDRP